MDLKIFYTLLHQRIRENYWFSHSGLLLLTILGFGKALIGQRRKAVKILSQVHRTSRSQWMRRLVETYISANRDAVETENLPSVNLNIVSLFGNRLMVLKAPAPSGEKGVLLVMFTEVIRALPFWLNVRQLLQDYTLVLEPSWSGYCCPEILQFIQFQDDIFVLAAEENDFAFLQRLGSNLIPVNLGPCDWVDPRVAAPYLENSKEFDIVMNSTWAAWKRHYVLFRMLANAKQRYRVVLIGVKWDGRTITDMETLAAFYGVREQITILENLSYERVMDITCKSRVSILLSLKEACNRAIAESIFCNVPVVVLSTNVGGIKKKIVPQTGVLTDERHLESAISGLLYSGLRPRDWALENVSCSISSKKLNTLLLEHARKKGEPWTRDIAGRSNSPESKYICDAEAEDLRPWNQGLTNYLRHV